MEGFQNKIFSLPTMYGDHHVVKARQIVAALPGVGEVRASAAQKKLTVAFDPAKVTAEAIGAALTQGGYRPAGLADGLAGAIAAGPVAAGPVAYDELRIVAAAEQSELREVKYSPPPAFGVCPGLETRYVGSEHPADRK